jgi:hypothetical protein
MNTEKFCIIEKLVNKSIIFEEFSLREAVWELERIRYELGGNERFGSLPEYCLTVLMKPLVDRLSEDKSFEKSLEEIGLVRQLFYQNSVIFGMIEILANNKSIPLQLIVDFEATVRKYLLKDFNYIKLEHHDFLHIFCNESNVDMCNYNLAQILASSNIIISSKEAKTKNIVLLASLEDFTVKICKSHLDSLKTSKAVTTYDRMKNGELGTLTWKVGDLSQKRFSLIARSLKVPEIRKKIFYFDYRIGWIKGRVIENFKRYDHIGGKHQFLRIDLSSHIKTLARLSKHRYALILLIRSDIEISQKDFDLQLIVDVDCKSSCLSVNKSVMLSFCPIFNLSFLFDLIDALKRDTKTCFNQLFSYRSSDKAISQPHIRNFSPSKAEILNLFEYLQKSIKSSEMPNTSVLFNLLLHLVINLKDFLFFSQRIQILEIIISLNKRIRNNHCPNLTCVLLDMHFVTLIHYLIRVFTVSDAARIYYLILKESLQSFVTHDIKVFKLFVLVQISQTLGHPTKNNRPRLNHSKFLMMKCQKLLYTPQDEVDFVKKIRKRTLRRLFKSNNENCNDRQLVLKVFNNAGNVNFDEINSQINGNIVADQSIFFAELIFSVMSCNVSCFLIFLGDKLCSWKNQILLAHFIRSLITDKVFKIHKKDLFLELRKANIFSSLICWAEHSFEISDIYDQLILDLLHWILSFHEFGIFINFESFTIIAKLIYRGSLFSCLFFQLESLLKCVEQISREKSRIFHSLLKDKLFAHPKLAELAPSAAFHRYKQMAAFSLSSLDFSPIYSIVNEISDLQGGQNAKLLESVLPLFDQLSDFDLSNLIQTMDKSESDIQEACKPRFLSQSDKIKSIMNIIGIFVDDPNELSSGRCFTLLADSETFSDVRRAEIKQFKLRRPDFGNWFSNMNELEISNLLNCFGKEPDNYSRYKFLRHLYKDFVQMETVTFQKAIMILASKTETNVWKKYIDILPNRNRGLLRKPFTFEGFKDLLANFIRKYKKGDKRFDSLQRDFISKVEHLRQNEFSNEGLWRKSIALNYNISNLILDFTEKDSNKLLIIFNPRSALKFASTKLIPKSCSMTFSLKTRERVIVISIKTRGFGIAIFRLRTGIKSID